MIELDRATHVYSSGKPSVTEFLKDCGIIDNSHYTEEGRKRGSAVHLACQYLDQADLDDDSLDPVIIGYVRSYSRWRSFCGFTPEWIEISIGNGLYAGTPDRVIISRPRALYDLKTGAYQRWHAIQTALYVNLLEDPYSYQRFGIYLKEDGSLPSVREFPKTELSRDLTVGLAALTIYNWKRRQ